MIECAFGEAIRDFAIPPPHPRLAIHRNNIASALVHALGVRYPVTKTLAGGTRFETLAGRYALAHLPSDPVLIRFGESLPPFIAASEAIQDLPWLADVARLESLWWNAYHAAEAEPLAAEAFATLPPEELFDLSFRFHPSLAIMESPYPVGSIWQACKQGEDSRSDWGNEGEFLLVARPHVEVLVNKLSPAAHAFISRLMSGTLLGPAYEDLSTSRADFGLNRELSALIRSEIITGLSI